MNKRTLHRPARPAILPDPFEWIHIPSGQVRLRYPPYRRVDQHCVEVEDFFIAKYPITNAQYQVYLAKTGRSLDRRRPDYDQPEFNKPLQPVIDLWWYEAMQFCEWLSNETGYLITLPTHAQWQRAAQGDDDRRYPWGNEWDSDLCNSLHNEIRHTTPVTQYPDGASPFGVMDMVGNVCEWCLTDANTGENSLDYEVPESPSLSGGNERIFLGGYYFSSRASANVVSTGAMTTNWYSYCCGIRLVTG